MEKIVLMKIEIERTLNAFVQYAVDEFLPLRKYDDGGKRALERKNLMIASSLPDDDLNKLPQAIMRVSSWLRAFDLMMVGENTKIKPLVRKIDQLKSIYHIGQTFPDKAIKRSIELRGK